MSWSLVRAQSPRHLNLLIMHIVCTILAILFFTALYVGVYIFAITMASKNCPEGTDVQEYVYKCIVDSMHYTNQLYL